MQPDLFDARTLARRTDPPTSHAAAEQAEPVINRHHRIIMGYLADLPFGGTSYDIAGGVGLENQQVNKRMRELERNGLVLESERRGLTPSGRSAIIWRAA